MAVTAGNLRLTERRKGSSATSMGVVESGGNTVVGPTEDIVEAGWGVEPVDASGVGS